MKQYFIIQEGHSCLTLFFTGWGMDFRPFVDYHPVESDLLVCYDYRTLDFDYSLLGAYDEVRLVAWSMGVWAASRVFAGGEYTMKSIAVNGTNYPVDDNRGIPGKIFEGTLNSLTDATLQKFYRRMCGSAESFKGFMERAPQRPVGELKEELAKIREQSELLPFTSFKWDKAVVGLQDRIFTADNQLRAFTEPTVVTEKNIAHYSEIILRETVEQWINN